MATYKVIQDIEAEDKLVGPLSLRQFIYGVIAAFCGYLSFIALTKGAAFLLVIFAPVMIFTGFFAFPWGRDQSTEVWALAKIRFFIKPRRRIWDQTGAKNLVEVTAPKWIEKAYTNGLTQTQVRSRLSALANTLDSHGWVIKNVNTNLYDPARSPVLPDSDRLVTPSSIPQEVSAMDIAASDDILDEANNPVAHNLDRLVHASSATHRRQLIEQLQQLGDITKPALPAQQSAPADYWFLNQPLDLPKPQGVNVTSPAALVITPDTAESNPAQLGETASAPNEKALAEKLKANRQNLQTINYQHMKTIQPLGEPKTQIAPAATPKTQTVPVTPLSYPAKMSLATRDDLNIATIGRLANEQDTQPDEVVISLHDHAS